MLHISDEAIIFKSGQSSAVGMNSQKMLIKLCCQPRAYSQDFTQNLSAKGHGGWGGSVPLPNRLGGLGSVMSSPGWVQRIFWHI